METDFIPTNGEIISIINYCNNTDLSSRNQASRLRNHILTLCQFKVTVILDFTDIRTISLSFADETLGVLAQEYGPDWIKLNIQLFNMNDCVREEIIKAIFNRVTLD